MEIRIYFKNSNSLPKNIKTLLEKHDIARTCLQCQISWTFLRSTHEECDELPHHSYISEQISTL